MEIGLQVIIKVKDHLHQETTESYRSQSMSMTTTSIKFSGAMWEFSPGSKAIGTQGYDSDVDV